MVYIFSLWIWRDIGNGNKNFIHLYTWKWVHSFFFFILFFFLCTLSISLHNRNWKRIVLCSIFYIIVLLDELRRQIWPALLELDPLKADPAPDQSLLESHPEYQQVVLDVNRSLKRFPPGIPYARRVALQDQLTRLILRVISKYPHLRYYQVCNLFLDLGVLWICMWYQNLIKIWYY